MQLSRPRAVAWFMALVMPFQGVIAAYVGLQGPAHFHLDHEFFEHSHDGDDDHHHHRHDRAERHHHPAADPTVVTVDDDAALQHLAMDEDAQQGAAMMMLALVSPGGLLRAVRSPNAMPPAADRFPKSRSLGRLERPPQASFA